MDEGLGLHYGFKSRTHLQERVDISDFGFVRGLTVSSAFQDIVQVH